MAHLKKILCFLLLRACFAQLGVFNLPHAQRFAAKPTVPPELKKYFELDDHALGLVDSVIGPRPGGFFPPKSYEIGRSSTKNLVQTQTSNPLSEVERTLEHFLTGSDSARLPPGFNQGFSLSRGSEDILSSYSSSKKSTVCNFVDLHPNLCPNFCFYKCNIKICSIKY